MLSKSSSRAKDSSKSRGLSPKYWDARARLQAEQQQAEGWTPTETKLLKGANGAICAVASPIAVLAGLQALDLGGTAADAAAAIALTQVATELGSVVSYAGVMSLVYYDVQSSKVHSMDAGYNSYLEEKEPFSIPICDLGPLNQLTKPSTESSGIEKQRSALVLQNGRKTLVPGFMAGIESMHKRFGNLKFARLFEPAIWYAKQGVVVNPILEKYFSWRKIFLDRTEAGRKFIQQAGDEHPRSGSLFFQKDLAKTLRSVARLGSAYMYSGAWGKRFVNAIQNEGGKVTLEDLRRYEVIWSEPLNTTFCAHKVYTAGLPNCGAYNVLTALNLAESLGLDRRADYWREPATLRDLTGIGYVTNGAPQLSADVALCLSLKGIDISPANQLTKEYARSVAPLIERMIPVQKQAPRHSNSIVVVDRHGNVAALTHTINTVSWGDTGIVIGGVPIPDSAGFQQARLASIAPGGRLPHEMSQTIVFGAGKPVLATAAIGSSMIPETVKIILGVTAGQHCLNTLQSAPPLICNVSVR